MTSKWWCRAYHHSSEKRKCWVLRIKGFSRVSLEFSFFERCVTFLLTRVGDKSPFVIVFGGHIGWTHWRGKSLERPDKFQPLQTFVSLDTAGESRHCSRTEAIRKYQRRKWYKAIRACRWYKTTCNRDRFFYLYINWERQIRERK